MIEIIAYLHGFTSVQNLEKIQQFHFGKKNKMCNPLN